MGKKSRKRGAAVGSNHKERLQERREQQLEGLDRDEPNVAPEQREREFFIGDRVWFHDEHSWGDGKNPYSYRGIVKRVDAKSVYILSLQSMMDGNHSHSALIEVSKGEKVYPDFCDLTLRFNLGDRVLCKTNYGWIPSTITYLWPIGEITIQGMPIPQKPEDDVPRYKCKHVDNDPRYEYECAGAPYDDDGCIIKHQSSFRFEVGESVVFNVGLATATGKSAAQLKNKLSWHKGTVSAVDVTGLEHYAAYTCSFDVAGKQYSCHVIKDDDEHITRKNADPGSRLFEAIELDCSRSHLIYLTTTYNIDVTTFSGLVMAKALECASYNALSWLQHNCNIDVLHIKDDSGNNFLHKIASSSQAARFIKEAGRFSIMNPIPDWKLDLFHYKLNLTTSLNNNDETWLQILVRRRDSHAFDAALSPNSGLAWELSISNRRFPTDKLSSLAESVKDAKDVIMQCIFDSFISFLTLNRQWIAISGCYSESEEDLFHMDSMLALQGGDASHHAKLLARFLLDWQEHSDRNGRECFPFHQFVLKGFFRLFSLLYDADDRLFLNKTYTCWSNENRNEYIQPELSEISNGGSNSSNNDWRQVDIATACIVGDNRKSYRSTRQCDESRYYFRDLRKHAVSCDPDKCHSWLSHLKRICEEENKDGDKLIWKNKISLLEDDDNLQGRLQILEYLLTRQPRIELNVLEAIRHHQCGVLRFMVDRDLVQVESSASSNIIFCTKNASKLQFLESGRIPSSMSTKHFLCFAAVEYDDLQSLQWICESFVVPAQSWDGWNLLHFSAFMGRIEIVAWLHTQPVWQSLNMDECRRKPFQNAFAVHIAAIQGHILLVELLLALKVRTEDGNGKLPEDYAKKSQHKIAQEWAKERDKPRALEKNIKKLLQLVNVPHVMSESMKSFVITSKCLDTECGFVNFDEAGHRVCHLRYDFWRSNETNPKADQEQLSRILNRDELLSFAASKGYCDLANYLQLRWFNEINCVDPLSRNFLLKSAFCKGDRLLEICALVLRVVLLVEMALISDDSFRSLINHGGSPNELDTILRIGAAVKKYLIDEGYAESGYNYDCSSMDWLTKPIDMLAYIRFDYPFEHTLYKQLYFTGKRHDKLARIHIVLATEGFSELIEYCLRNMQGWTAVMELEVVRLAAFYGHSRILDIFLRGVGLLSNANDHLWEAMLGFGEACRSRDIIQLLESHGAHPVKDDTFSCDDYDGRQAYARHSLVCAVLNGYENVLFDSDTDTNKDLKTLLVLVEKFEYSHDDILYAAEILVSTFCYSIDWMGRFVGLLQNAFEALNLEPVNHQVNMQALCKAIVEEFGHNFGRSKKTDDLERRVLKWLGEIADQGVDIQNMAPNLYSLKGNDFMEQFLELGKRQLHNWSQFNVLINGGSLKDIQDVIEHGGLSVHARYRGGLLLTHLSSAYDRVDLLEWLIVTKGMDVNSKDGQGRSVLEIAKTAQAASSTKWIVEHQARQTIVTFVQRHHRRMLATRKRQRLACAATIIQRKYRGHSVRKIYGVALLQRLEASQRFHAVWGHLVYSDRDFTQIAPNWSSIRERVSNINHTECMHDDCYFGDTDELLSKSLDCALQMKDYDDMSAITIVKCYQVQLIVLWMSLTALRMIEYHG
ncbi:hypothetical protein ACHAW5_005270 [Stephanodiscus triporus]|uniref:Calmodulin n=1 Tax=Stephanodiscus triporus TaxID=2934178 RepID=A0ABD3PCT6_9STRA